MRVLTWRGTCPECGKNKLAAAVSGDHLITECMACGFTSTGPLPEGQRGEART